MVAGVRQILPLDMDRYVPHGRGVLDPRLLRRVHETSIGRGSLRSIGGYRVYAVDGTLVRNAIHVDFTTGGNPGRYSYVPEGEVWVERVLEPADLAASLYHELVETVLMESRGLDYDAAHEEASRVEVVVRRAMVWSPSRRSSVTTSGALRQVSRWFSAWRRDALPIFRDLRKKRSPQRLPGGRQDSKWVP